MNTPRHTTETTNRDRSYRVAEHLAAGDCAEIAERVLRYGEVVLIPGDVVEVVAYSNAGFRGIEATVRDMRGRTYHGVSAGILRGA